MKLLLTSIGVSNDSIRTALVDLLGKPVEECKVVLVPTGVYYDDECDEAAPPGAGDHRGLGRVDFVLRPHLDSEDFPDTGMAMMERAAARVDVPLYAIDDQTAVKVVADRVEVVSEGRWKLFDRPGAGGDR